MAVATVSNWRRRAAGLTVTPRGSRETPGVSALAEKNVSETALRPPPTAKERPLIFLRREFSSFLFLSSLVHSKWVSHRTALQAYRGSLLLSFSPFSFSLSSRLCRFTVFICRTEQQKPRAAFKADLILFSAEVFQELNCRVTCSHESDTQEVESEY